MKPTIITIENANPFDAGWHACHFGLPSDCIRFDSEMAQQSFDEGFRMRQETADMNNPHDVTGHGHAHIGFLIQATHPFPEITWARSRVSISHAGEAPSDPSGTENQPAPLDKPKS